MHTAGRFAAHAGAAGSTRRQAVAKVRERLKLLGRPVSSGT